MLRRMVLSITLIVLQASLARPGDSSEEKSMKAQGATAAAVLPNILTLAQTQHLKQPPSGPLVLYLSLTEWSRAVKEMEPTTAAPPEGSVVIHAIADSRGGVVLVPSCRSPKEKICRVMAQMEKGGLSLYPRIEPTPISPREAVGSPPEPSHVTVDTCRHVLGLDPSTGLPLPFCSGSRPRIPVPGGASFSSGSCRPFLANNGDSYYFYCACTTPSG